MGLTDINDYTTLPVTLTPGGGVLSTPCPDHFWPGGKRPGTHSCSCYMITLLSLTKVNEYTLLNDSILTGPGAHKAPCTMGTRSVSPRSEVVRAWCRQDTSTWCRGYRQSSALGTHGLW